MKPSKTFTDRFKVTRRGKILARPTGQDHFNAKERRRKQLRKKRTVPFLLSKKTMSHFFRRGRR